MLLTSLSDLVSSHGYLSAVKLVFDIGTDCETIARVIKIMGIAVIINVLGTLA